MADIVYELKAILGLDSSGFSDGLDDARKQLGSSGLQGVATRIGNGVTAAVTKGTKALLSFGRTAVTVGMDFDATMSAVKAVSGANAEEFDQLREAAMLMGRTTKFTATESAQALYYMGMAGWDANQMIEGLPAIMRLAAASGEDLATVSDIVTDSLTAYGLTADDAAHYADVLAATATSSNTNVAMLGETFKYAAPLAGVLGYTVEDTAVAFGLMANSGIKASMAGTALRGFLTRLAKPTKESATAMARLGISLTDETGRMYTFMELMQNMRTAFTEGLQIGPQEYADELAALEEQFESGTLAEEEYEEALTWLNERAFGDKAPIMAMLAAQLGGQRALSGLLAIVNATEEDFDSLTASIYGASETMALIADGSVIPLSEALARGETVLREYNGAAEAMSAIMLDNLSGDVTLLRSAWEGFQLEFASKFTPALREVMPRIIDAVGRLTEKLADMDLSKLADGLATLAEKAMDLIGYLIEHGDEVIALMTTLAGTVFLGKGINTAQTIFGGARTLFSGIGSIFTGGAATGSATEAAASSAPAVGKTLGAAASGPFWSNLLAASPLAAIVGGLIIGGKQGWDYGSAATARGTLGDSATVAEYEALIADLENELAELDAEIASLTESGADTTWAYIERAGLENSLSTAKTNLEEARALLADNSDMEAYGEDAMASYAAGIIAGAPQVISAVSGVALGIWSLLHHSEPETGPLANDSTWMPDMMAGFAQDIRDGAPALRSALSDALDFSPATGGIAGSGATTIINNIHVEGGLDPSEAIAERISAELSALFGREAAALG